jgi:hypothetical protein
LLDFNQLSCAIESATLSVKMGCYLRRERTGKPASTAPLDQPINDDDGRRNRAKGLAGICSQQSKLLPS